MKRPVRILIAILLLLVFIFVMISSLSEVWMYFKEQLSNKNGNQSWTAPDINQLPPGEEGDLIRYGRELIVHTATYLGPRGSVRPISNGMNCQNCHLEAGTKFFGNNYSAVASTYPKYRSRSGTLESIEKRVNDCIERSLNGSALDINSREMQAMVSYIKWLGSGVDRGVSPQGTGLPELLYLNRPANKEKGRLVYEQKCVTCHGQNGEGMMQPDNSGWLNPPLWGAKSYNIGAGLYRLSRFAGYVKANMPFGATYNQPQLTDEEAWDVAAFVNSMPRPFKDLSQDWPDVSEKPVDHPFGPYADEFDEVQHKYGPFKPIEERKKVLKAQ
jgi:thiosulfate dehydrogenase